MTSSSEPRRRGPERTRALLDSTLELASEVGYRGMTIEAIARKSGVGKHTIYRRWSTISELLLDALNHVWVSGLDYRVGGDVRDDLREQFLRSSSALSQPPIGPIYRAVIADAQSEERLRANLHARFLTTVEQRTFDRIRLAQDQGQLRADVDLRYAAEMLAGTLYYRYLLTPLPVDEDAIDGLIGMFMDAYGAPGSDHVGEGDRE